MPVAGRRTDRVREMVHERRLGGPEAAPAAAMRLGRRSPEGSGSGNRQCAVQPQLVPAGIRRVVLMRLKKLLSATISTSAPSCLSS
jgi:hypothetical protein